MKRNPAKQRQRTGSYTGKRIELVLTHTEAMAWRKEVLGVDLSGRLLVARPKVIERDLARNLGHRGSLMAQIAGLPVVLLAPSGNGVRRRRVGQFLPNGKWSL